MIGCTIHSARQPQLSRGARLNRSAPSAMAWPRARRRVAGCSRTSASTNSTQGELTCSIARVQAQFLPTQRSPAGLGPASSSAKRWPASPQAAAAACARAAVASVEPSFTTSTRQSAQGASLPSRLVRQGPMLVASL